MEKLISTKLKELAATTKLLAVCPITGIIIRLEVPACTAILDYRNPLADITNIAALVEKEKSLESLPQEVLAGMLLALLKKRRLLAESKLSAAEQNLLLQTVPAKVLIAALQLVVRFTKEQALILTIFSLDSQLITPEGKEFKLFLVLNNILAVWKETIFPNILHIDSSNTAEELKSLKLPKTSTILTTDIKAELKDLLNKLIIEDVASDKVIRILKIALSGQNILSLLAPGGVGEKLIAALDSYQTTTASLLAEKLQTMQKNLTAKEKAEQLFSSDSSLDRISDLAESNPKRTLAELLAYKKEQRLLDSQVAEGKEENKKNEENNNEL